MYLVLYINRNDTFFSQRIIELLKNRFSKTMINFLQVQISTFEPLNPKYTRYFIGLLTRSRIYFLS